MLNASLVLCENDKRSTNFNGHENHEPFIVKDVLFIIKADSCRPKHQDSWSSKSYSLFFYLVKEIKCQELNTAI